VVGAASAAVLDQVAGPGRTGRVLHAGSDAIYVELDGSCLAVLSSRAVQVPCGVRTPLPLLPTCSAGAPASVRHGCVRVPGCEVLASEVVDVAVPELGRGAVEWARDHLPGAVGGRLAGVAGQLPVAPLAALAEGDPACVMSLLGLGPGLTPLGDDLLSGWLATAVAVHHPGLAGVRDAVALHATRRTTLLSATLLACASRGEAVPELRSLLAGIAVGSAELAERSLVEVQRIGQTSGEGLLLGAVVALGVRTER